MTISPASLRSSELRLARELPIPAPGCFWMSDVTCKLLQTHLLRLAKKFHSSIPLNMLSRYRKLIRQRALRKLRAASESARCDSFGICTVYVSTSDGCLVRHLTRLGTVELLQAAARAGGRSDQTSRVNNTHWLQCRWRIYLLRSPRRFFVDSLRDT